MPLIAWVIYLSWSVYFYEHLPVFANSIGVSSEESANIILSLSGLFLL